MAEVYYRNNPYRGPVRAVILDWAGTTVDYGAFGNIRPFIDGLREHWIDVTPDEVREHMGLAPWDHLAAILNEEKVRTRWLDIYGVPPSEFELDKILRSIENLAPDAAVLHSAPVPGLLETIATLKNEGIGIGSTSSRTFRTMEAVSEAARQAGYVPDAVVCSSDVPGGRPMPWMCLRNAIDLEVFPVEAIVKIGDTVPDIQEGLNAGMWTVGVTKTGNSMGMLPEEIAQADPTQLQGQLGLIEKNFMEAGAHFVIEGIWECTEIIEQVNQLLARGEKP